MDTNIHLDELDMLIAKELDINARYTTRDLGAKLGVSASTISSRMRKMVDNGAITFAVLCNPTTLGFQNTVVLGLRANFAKSANVAAYLRGCRSVQMLSLTTGRYNLLLYAVFRDNRELIDWITRLPDGTTVEGFSLLQVMKNSYMRPPGDHNPRSTPLKPRGLDALDITLIKELEESPRETIGNLETKTGIGRKKISTRLKRLLDQGTIRVVSIVNPEVLGFALRAFVFLKAEVDRIVPIAQLLAADNRIGHVSIINGRFDVMLHAGFSCPEELFQFVEDELNCIPGIVDYEFLINTGPQHFRWGLLS